MGSAPAKRSEKWGGVSFVRSTKDVLARCMREKGTPPDDQRRLLDGLSATFDEWLEAFHGAVTPAGLSTTPGGFSERGTGLTSPRPAPSSGGRAGSGLAGAFNCSKLIVFRLRLPLTRHLLRLGDLRRGHEGRELSLCSAEEMSPSAAARLYHMWAATKSCGTPSPPKYMPPKSACALKFPWSAARRYHFTASAAFGCRSLPHHGRR